MSFQSIVMVTTLFFQINNAHLEQKEIASETEPLKAEVTVGAPGSHIAGWNSIAVQAAIDYASQRGFRTVRLSGGSYTFRSSVHIPSGIRVIGKGESTVIRPTEAARTAISADSEWYQQSIEVEDADAFSVGDSIQIACTEPDLGWAIDRRVVAKHGKKLLLDDPLGQNIFVKHKPQCSNLHSIFVVLQSKDVEISNLRIDGKVGITETLNGNFGAAVFLTKSSRVTLSGVTVHGFNGDAFSIQESQDIELNVCEARGNSSKGLHLGSGSHQLTCSTSKFLLNGTGVFLCWGVKQVALNNIIVSDSIEAGVSIGHYCQSLTVSSCRINGNGGAGLLVRSDSIGTGGDCPADILVIGSAFADNGRAGSQVPELQLDCAVRDLQIRENTFSTGIATDTRPAIGLNEPQAFATFQNGNSFVGFAGKVVQTLEPRQP